MDTIRALKHLLAVAFVLTRESVGFLLFSFRSTEALTAGSLFLRRQLAYYTERKAKARRADDGTRLALVLLSKLFAWRDDLVIVKLETVMRWHRKGFRLFWRWKSRRRGRPRLRKEIRELIVEMANQNQTWGEERIAAEILLKLDVKVSSRNGKAIYA